MNGPLSQLLALARAELPARVWQSNPARVTWQQNVAAQQSRVEAAQRTLDSANTARDRARTAAEQHALEEPDNPIINRWGKEVQNPEYAPWKKRRDELRAVYTAAQQAANAAQTDYARESGALLTLLAQEPVGQVVVDNPAYANWLQEIGAARAVLEAARWDQLFDVEVAALRTAATSARAAWQQGIEMVDRLALKLTEQRQLEPQLAAQVVTLSAAVQAAQQESNVWADALQAALDEERRLLAQEPPQRQIVPNPAWTTWQELLAQMQRAYDDARANAAAPEAALAQAQREVDQHKSIEPPKTIREGNGRPQPNPDYGPWVEEHAVLVEARDAALARVLPYRQAVERAYGDVINTMGAQPPTTMEVDNPAYAPWRAKMDKAGLAVGNATLRANRAATALATALAALAGPQADLALVRLLLATLPAELSAAQAAITALVATRNSTESALALAEQRAAVVLDQPASDDAVVVTFQELFRSLGEAEAELRAFEDEIAPADDELWRLQARIGELQRTIAQAAADTQKVNDAEAAYNKKVQAVQDKLNSRPRP